MKFKFLFYFCLIFLNILFIPKHVYSDCSALRTVFSDIRLDVSYNMGKFIDIKKDYTEIGLFLPVGFADRWLTFAEARSYHFNHSKWGANAGLGLRWLSDERLGGINLYYDYLAGRFHQGFHGLGIGLEFLGASYDLRANGYFPVSHSSHHSKLFIYDDFIGSYVATCREREFMIRQGFDAEFGLPLACWRGLALYGALGPYYYHPPRCHTNYWGGQARLELGWRNYLSLQVRTSYDHSNHFHAQGRIEVNFPFEIFNPLHRCESFYSNLSTQPVVRNGIIFTDHCCSFTKNW